MRILNLWRGHWGLEKGHSLSPLAPQVKMKLLKLVAKKLSKKLKLGAFNTCNLLSSLTLKNRCLLSTNCFLKIFFFKIKKFLKNLTENCTLLLEHPDLANGLKKIVK